jgi:phosphoenolpyruvate carboxylase
MPDAAQHDFTIGDDLLAMTERARARAEEDPFGNPVLAVALSISRQMDEGRRSLR